MRCGELCIIIMHKYMLARSTGGVQSTVYITKGYNNSIIILLLIIIVQYIAIQDNNYF